MSLVEPQRQRRGFEEILNDVGGASYFQFLVFMLMLIPDTVQSMMSHIPVFVAYDQDYKCRWNETADGSVPGNGSLVLDKCHVYRNETPDLQIPCSEWDFDTSVLQETIRSQYVLTCGSDSLAELSTTLYFIGFVIGSAFYGWISDRIGRLPAILISATHLSVSCAAAAVSPVYWMFATFRMIAGIANGGLLATYSTMMSEVTDVEHRLIYNVLVHNGFTIGGCLLTLIAYFIPDPRRMQLTVAGLILSVWICPLLIPESPRWLYTTGRWKRAEKALKYVARINRREFSEDIFKNPSDDHNNEITDAEIPIVKVPDENKASIFDVLRKGRLAITLFINWFGWFTVSLGYFASLYTIGDLGGDIYINVILGAIIEIPSRILCIFFAKYWGRIPVISLSFIMGTVGCYINAVLIVFPDLTLGRQIVAIFIKFVFSIDFTMIWAYSGELFPTVVRNIGMGLGSMSARIGGTLAPQVPLLGNIWPPLPLVVMGSVPILAALLFLLQPETLNKDLLETVKDLHRLVTDGSRLGYLLKKMNFKEESGNRVDSELVVPVSTRL